VSRKGFEPLWGAPRGGALRWWARFLAGRPLDGRRRSDATWARRGRAYIGPGWHTRWELLPGWAVLAVRLVLVWLGLAGGRWLLSSPDAAASAVLVTARVLRGVGSGVVLAVRSPVTAGGSVAGVGRVVLVVVLVVAVRRLSRGRREVLVVRPLARALAGPLGRSAEAPSGPWLRVPRALAPAPPLAVSVASGVVLGWLRSWAEGRGGRAARVAARLRPPAWWVAARSRVAVRLAPARAWWLSRARVRVDLTPEIAADAEAWEGLPGVVRAVLGEPELSASWRLAGARPRLLLARRARPPERVSLEQVRPHLEALTGAGDLLVGVSAGMRPVTWTPASDSPHALLSMGSGAGKSVLLRFLAMQALAQGSAVVIIDFKADHYWARELIDAGTRGLWYFRKVEEIHTALVELERVRAWRADVAWDARGDVQFQPVMVLLEEMNATATQLRAWWADHKPKGGAQRSPAMAAFGGLSNAGRSASVHLVAVGQYLTAQVMGGPEARESFGLRVLGRYTAAAWRTLVPEHAYVPRSSIRGRVQAMSAAGRTETQVPYVTHDEAVRYVRESLPVVGAQVVPFSWEVGGGTGPAGIGGAAGDDLLALVDAVAPGGPLDGRTLAAVRKAAQRPGFPVPVQAEGRSRLYRRAELADWAAGPLELSGSGREEEG